MTYDRARRGAGSSGGRTGTRRCTTTTASRDWRRRTRCSRDTRLNTAANSASHLADVTSCQDSANTADMQQLTSHDVLSRETGARSPEQSTPVKPVTH